ncbi:hypothetical protein POVCU1_026810 [Plasmodium ovale curtisi]|uniref:Uncharacterized protein n=1 Tax=Plasmodium ovale curtisi TaxID=864141 RepID=A0A1A8WRB9_PLAOA|nr:hypothetical protein POVCU1_026810 [Plasmodium ovale curtisi]
MWRVLNTTSPKKLASYKSDREKWQQGKRFMDRQSSPAMLKKLIIKYTLPKKKKKKNTSKGRHRVGKGNPGENASLSARIVTWRRMAYGSSKKVITVYYIKNGVANEGMERKVKGGPRGGVKRGCVTIEITPVEGEKHAFKKRENDIILSSRKRDEYRPMSTKKIHSQKKLKETWSKAVFDMLHDTTNRLNEKINSLFSVCILKSGYLSNDLKINSKMLEDESLNYFNAERARMLLSCAGVYDKNICSKEHSYGSLPMAKIRKFQSIHDKFSPCNSLTEKYKKTGYTYIDSAPDDSITRFSTFINSPFHKNLPEINTTLFNRTIGTRSYSNNKGRHINKKNNKIFYISVINKKTNVKNVRKISLMEICNYPHFFISQGFLSEVESYLALNHCLLYVKKSKGELSQIYNNFYSILINIDEVNFLEEKVSMSILRHIIKRFKGLFKIRTNDITSIEFCLYIKSDDQSEVTNFTEKYIYKYSIIIFLNNKNDNFVIFPNSGLKIMTVTGSCLIYECNVDDNVGGNSNNSASGNIFNFDISEEKLFFLKLNLRENINLQEILESRMNSSSPFEHLYRDINLRDYHVQPSSPNEQYPYNRLANKNLYKNAPTSTDLMQNHHSYVKKNMDIISKEIMQLNVNRMNNLLLQANNGKAYAPVVVPLAKYQNGPMQFLRTIDVKNKQTVITSGHKKGRKIGWRNSVDFNGYQRYPFKGPNIQSFKNGKDLVYSQIAQLHLQTQPCSNILHLY